MIFLAQYNFTEDETAAFCFKVKLDFLLLVFLAMTNLFHLTVLTVLLHRATPAILEVLRRERRVL